MGDREPGQRDVMVVDIFGKVKDGTVVGDNLGTAVKVRTGAGAVIDGGIRDYQGLVELDDVNFYFRGMDPSAIADVTLAGINIPVRIGPGHRAPGRCGPGTPTGVIGPSPCTWRPSWPSRPKTRSCETGSASCAWPREVHQRRYRRLRLEPGDRGRLCDLAPERHEGMKIADARVIVASPGRNYVTLKIETDAGILTGLGDATLNGRELAVALSDDTWSPCYRT